MSFLTHFGFISLYRVFLPTSTLHPFELNAAEFLHSVTLWDVHFREWLLLRAHFCCHLLDSGRISLFSKYKLGRSRSSPASSASEKGEFDIKFYFFPGTAAAAVCCLFCPLDIYRKWETHLFELGPGRLAKKQAINAVIGLIKEFCIFSRKKEFVFEVFQIFDHPLVVSVCDVGFFYLYVNFSIHMAYKKGNTRQTWSFKVV